MKIKLFFLSLIVVCTVNTNAQKSDTLKAFQFLEKFSLGIPITQNFDAWEHYVTTSNKFFYDYTDYNKTGYIFSKIYTKYIPKEIAADSVRLILQNIEFKDKANSNNKDTSTSLVLDFMYNVIHSKERADSLFNALETGLKNYFKVIKNDNYSTKNSLHYTYFMKYSHAVPLISISKFIDLDYVFVTIQIIKRKEYEPLF